MTITQSVYSKEFIPYFKHEESLLQSLIGIGLTQPAHFPRRVL